MHWLAVLVVGRTAQLGPPLLAAMRWWSSRGTHASFKRDEEGKLLIERLLVWGRSVVHIFDQGFAGAFWLGVVLAYALLLHLLGPRYGPLRLWLLRHFCHRTGWHLRRVTVPLYRLRSALSRLWQRYPPCFAALGR